MSFELTTIGEFASVQGGYAYKSQDFQLTAKWPVLKIKNVRHGYVDYSDTSFVSDSIALSTSNWRTKTGDILISMTGSGPSAPESLVGRVARVWKGDIQALINQRVGRLVLKDGSTIDSDFLFYVLSTKETQDYLVSNSTGSANQVNISAKTIESVGCPKIGLIESRNIASFLRSLDKRIRLLRETNTTLEAIAQTLFKSWFVDFDPVKAKAEGLLPEGMDEATAALFPSEFEESALGLIPKGWRVENFGSLIESTVGGDWGDETPTDKNNIRVAIIRGTDIPDLKKGSDNRVPIRYTSEKKLSSRKLFDGDIVIEVSGGSKDQPTGRALYITDNLLANFDCPVEPASFCRLFRPNSKVLGVMLAQHLTYIYKIGKTWEYQNQSTGISNFQTTHFLNTELVVIPPSAILEIYCEIVTPIVRRTYLTQIKMLSDIRDTLLPRLISGQLRLNQAQEIMDEVGA